MSFFLRNAVSSIAIAKADPVPVPLLKENPYHDASGAFTSKGGSGHAPMHTASLKAPAKKKKPVAYKHGAGLVAAVVGALTGHLKGSDDHAAVTSAVDTIHHAYPGYSTDSKAKTIFHDLKNGKHGAPESVQAALKAGPKDTAQHPGYQAIHAAVKAHEQGADAPAQDAPHLAEKNAAPKAAPHKEGYHTGTDGSLYHVDKDGKQHELALDGSAKIPYGGTFVSAQHHANAGIDLAAKMHHKGFMALNGLKPEDAPGYKDPKHAVGFHTGTDGEFYKVHDDGKVEHAKSAISGFQAHPGDFTSAKHHGTSITDAISAHGPLGAKKPADHPKAGWYSAGDGKVYQTDGKGKTKSWTPSEGVQDAVLPVDAKHHPKVKGLDDAKTKILSPEHYEGAKPADTSKPAIGYHTSTTGALFYQSATGQQALVNASGSMSDTSGSGGHGLVSAKFHGTPSIGGAAAVMGHVAHKNLSVPAAGAAGGAPPENGYHTGEDGKLHYVSAGGTHYHVNPANGEFDEAGPGGFKSKAYHGKSALSATEAHDAVAASMKPAMHMNDGPDAIAKHLTAGGAPIDHPNGKTYWKDAQGVTYEKDGHGAGDLVANDSSGKKAKYALGTVTHYANGSKLYDPTGASKPVYNSMTAAAPPVIPGTNNLGSKPVKGKAVDLPAEAKDTHGTSAQLKKVASAIAGDRVLSTAERSALKHYQGSGYHEMNGALRRGKAIDADTFKQLKVLNKAIEDHVTTEDINVFRGVKKTSDVFGVGNIDHLVGHAALDNGYMSTSTNREFSRNWASGYGGDHDPPLLMEFKLPKGSPAMPVNHHTGSLEGERELLLGRGTMLKIKAVRQEKVGGKTMNIATMEYV